MSKITPCLWYAHDAEEAVALYISLLPDSRIDARTDSAADHPGGKAGDPLLIHFTLAGQRLSALNGGQKAEYTHAMSLQIGCDDQAEVDRLWDGLIAGGGAPIACGWLKDRWGVQWQIVPRALERLLADPDPDRARRAHQAMLGMVKIDIAALEQAANGA